MQNEDLKKTSCTQTQHQFGNFKEATVEGNNRRAQYKMREADRKKKSYHQDHKLAAKKKRDQRSTKRAKLQPQKTNPPTYKISSTQTDLSLLKGSSKYKRPSGRPTTREIYLQEKLILH